MNDRTVTDKQLKKLSEILKEVSMARYIKFLNEEIEAQPEKKDFLQGVQASAFFATIFERGFLEGISWGKENRKTRFVLSEE